MHIKNLKILVLLSLGFLVVAFGMYFDGKNTSNNSSSELLFPSFDDILPQIAYIEFSNQNGKSVKLKCDFLSKRIPESPY